jgi:hypothetical protein
MRACLSIWRADITGVEFCHSHLILLECLLFRSLRKIAVIARFAQKADNQRPH